MILRSFPAHFKARPGSSTSRATRRRTGKRASGLLPKHLGSAQGSQHAISDSVPVSDAVQKLMMALSAAEQIDPVIQAGANQEECEKRHHQGLQAAGQITVLGEPPESPVKLE